MNPEAPRMTHIDMAKGDDRTGVVVVQTTWECKACKQDVPKGQPCLKCGKRLLED